jgi:hypothetical protein
MISEIAKDLRTIEREMNDFEEMIQYLLREEVSNG